MNVLRWRAGGNHQMDMQVQRFWNIWVRDLMKACEENNWPTKLEDGSISPKFVQLVDHLQSMIDPKFRYLGNKEELRAAIERARNF